jgi:cation diffusion facilitator family transporter
MKSSHESRPEKASSPSHFREKMPSVTAWIDSLREAFGKEMVDKMIRTGLREGTFWAVENGLVVGRYATDPRFAFGTWKVEVLAGFTSAVFLLGIAALMVFGSIERILAPQAIHYQQAMIVAAVGLVVNVVCAFILGGAHHHGENGHGHGHDGHHHGHHDLNLKSAYRHVIADAATSVLAIVALAGGWLYGWSWLDPATGIVGAVLVAVWAKNLIVETGKVLLDRENDAPVAQEIRQAVETGGENGDTRVVDLHVWRVGKQSYSCALSVVTTDQTLTAKKVREQITVHEEIVHTTIEIHPHPGFRSSQSSIARPA